MSTHQSTAESLADIAIKASPPATVSIATLAGYQVSELLMWATLAYTLLMIGHKLVTIYKEFQSRKCKCQYSGSL